MIDYNFLSSISDEELIIGIYCKRNEFANNLKTEKYFKAVEGELTNRGYTPSDDIQLNEWWHLIVQRTSDEELVSLLKNGKIKKIVHEEIAFRRLSKETIKSIQMETEEITDMVSLNGFGTTLYGHTSKASDGSYVATKWIVISFIPIIPLKSYRVFSKKGVFFGFSKEYHLKRVILNKNQVFRTYLLVGGILLFLFLILLVNK